MSAESGEAHAQTRLGKLAEAEATHRRGTLCIEGANDESFLCLGNVFRMQGRLEEAATCFREALAIDPIYEAALEGLEDVEKALSFVGRKGE